MPRKRKLTKSECGRLGGQATVRRYGSGHMSAIGKAGFQAFAKKLGYMGGSRLGAIQWLQRKGKFPGLTPQQHAQHQQMFEELMEQLEPPPEEEDENPVVAAILRSIRSAPTPEWGGL